MDNIDRQIISILQKDARTPLKDIAKSVFLSSPSVSARIEKLQNEGVIKGYTATVDQVKLGYHIKAFIHLAMEPVQKPEFYSYIEKCPCILECSCVTGLYSMLMKVVFSSTNELDSFVNELQQFGRTDTQIVFSTPVEPRSVEVFHTDSTGQK